MNEIAKPNAIIEVGASASGLLPKNFEGLWRLATIMSASGFMPKGVEKVESVFVVIQMGLEVGLGPMQAVQNIACINGRPCIWGDAAMGLVEASGAMEDCKEFFENDSSEFPVTMAAVCHVKRKNGREATQRFSVADAKRAGLWGKSGPWTQYPRRMLQMRARGFALRDLFADVLKGLKTAEEVMDYDQDLVKINGTYQAKPMITGLPKEEVMPVAEEAKPTETPTESAMPQVANLPDKETIEVKPVAKQVAKQEPGHQQQPGQKKAPVNLADQPEWLDYIQAVEIDPQMASNARKTILKSDREPSTEKELSAVLREINRLMDESGL
jgi:hypothetical protein